MDNQSTSKELQSDLRKGKFFMVLFAAFIIGGIVTKRVYNHPEWMMAWHLPAAVFLVLGGKRLTYHQRKSYFSKKFTVKAPSGPEY